MNIHVLIGILALIMSLLSWPPQIRPQKMLPGLRLRYTILMGRKTEA